MRDPGNEIDLTVSSFQDKGGFMIGPNQENGSKHLSLNLSQLN